MMKRVALLVVAVLAVGLILAAADKPVKVTGYLSDKMCGASKGANHTKDCIEKCTEHGLGVVSGGKFIAFDDNGNKLASDILKNSKKDKGIKVQVEGTRTGDTIAVKNIKEV